MEKPNHTRKKPGEVTESFYGRRPPVRLRGNHYHLNSRNDTHRPLPGDLLTVKSGDVN